MYIIGAIIVSICIGIMYTAVLGWLTFGGIVLLAGVWEGVDDTIAKYNKSKKKN